VGAQDRDQYEKVDVEYYFNYMGCLAVEGTYDRMYKLVDGTSALLRRASCCSRQRSGPAPHRHHPAFRCRGGGPAED